jgi:hypothetical protein
MSKLFDPDVCGIDLAHGKPHPEIFERTADALGLSHEVCFVVEDAVSGIQAAKAGHMAPLGIARLDDDAMLAAAGADLVVTSLDDVSLSGIRNGHLERNAYPSLRARSAEDHVIRVFDSRPPDGALPAAETEDRRRNNCAEPGLHGI